MPSVDHLFDRFRAAYRAGERVDPQAYLSEVEGVERRELAALIDAFLAQDPGPSFDEPAFAAFEQDPLSQRIAAAIDAQVPADSWGELLPAARHRVQLTRTAVVRRLADALGVSDRREKVGDYYHAMETGSLSPRGVSRKVLDALSSILDVPVERLVAAGRAVAPPGHSAEVFARSSRPLEALTDSALPAEAELARDEVDELFAGDG